MKSFDDSVKAPSKKSVRKSGEVLAGRSDVMPIEEAMKILSDWRTLHAYPLTALQSHMRRLIKRHHMEKSLIAQRLKRTPSIIGKLTRFESMSLDRMQDIGGIRVIVPKMADVRKLHSLIVESKTFRHHLELPPKDYIEHPKLDGYRSLHQVIKYRDINHEALNGLKIEIQIRTRLQHSWATAVETVGLLERASLKTGEGDEKTKRFFKLVSALFSIDERCPVLDEYANMTLTELISETAKLEDELSILKKLEGVAVSAHRIDLMAKAGFTGFHVIQLHIPERSVRMYGFDDLEDAEIYYKSKEGNVKDDPNVSVLLMSAGDLKDIKKAYPNYFLDTKAFIQNVRRIMALGDRLAGR